MPRQEYIQRVTVLIENAVDWCSKVGLQTELSLCTLREAGTEEYEAPALHISKDGASVAKIVPVGSRIIAASGRVDLIGRIAAHALLFYVGKRSDLETAAIAPGGAVSASYGPKLHGVDEDGWYWIESSVRRAKRVDESLFIDLLTDVSDYEFCDSYGRGDH